MLSAQCDVLRLCARNLRAVASDSSLVWQASNEMEKAADTIWRLRNQLHTLQSEEERLTEENAELRELCADVWRFTRAACEKYPRLFDQSAQGGQIVQLNMLDEFDQHMEAFGIEVDG